MLGWHLTAWCSGNQLLSISPLPDYIFNVYFCTLCIWVSSKQGDLQKTKVALGVHKEMYDNHRNILFHLVTICQIKIFTTPKLDTE